MNNFGACIIFSSIFTTLATILLIKINIKKNITQNDESPTQHKISLYLCYRALNVLVTEDPCQNFPYQRASAESAWGGQIIEQSRQIIGLSTSRAWDSVWQALNVRYACCPSHLRRSKLIEANIDITNIQCSLYCSVNTWKKVAKEVFGKRKNYKRLLGWGSL